MALQLGKYQLPDGISKTMVEPFTNYKTDGAEAMAKALGQAGANLGAGVGNMMAQGRQDQQNASLAELGGMIGAGDYGGASKRAFELGQPDLGLKLATEGLHRTEQSGADEELRKILSPEGASPSAAPSSPGATPSASPEGGPKKTNDHTSYRLDDTQRAEMASAIRSTADKIGVDPQHLAAIMSFETGGTLDPWKAGPTTKWGQHMGLIQWGGPQREQYGIKQDMSITDQVAAAGKYLQDHGVKPGMGLPNIYSAVLHGNAASGLDVRDQNGTSANSGAANMMRTAHINALANLERGLNVANRQQPAPAPIADILARRDAGPLTSAGGNPDAFQGTPDQKFRQAYQQSIQNAGPSDGGEQPAPAGTHYAQFGPNKILMDDKTGAAVHQLQDPTQTRTPLNQLIGDRRAPVAPPTQEGGQPYKTASLGWTAPPTNGRDDGGMVMTPEDAPVIKRMAEEAARNAPRDPRVQPFKGPAEIQGPADMEALNALMAAGGFMGGNPQERVMQINGGPLQPGQVTPLPNGEGDVVHLPDGSAAPVTGRENQNMAGDYFRQRYAPQAQTMAELGSILGGGNASPQRAPGNVVAGDNVMPAMGQQPQQQQGGWDQNAYDALRKRQDNIIRAMGSEAFTRASDAGRNFIKSELELTKGRLSDMERLRPDNSNTIKMQQEWALRSQQAAQLGLQGDERKFFILNGKVPTAAESVPAFNQGYDRTAGEGFAKKYDSLGADYQTGNAQIGTIQQMRELVNSPTFYSGSGADQVNSLKKLAATVGLADQKWSSSNELFRALSDKLALDAVGGKLGAGVSNADVNFIRSMNVNEGMTKDTLNRMLDIYGKVAERKMQVFERASEYAQQHNGRLDAGFDRETMQWAKENPIFQQQRGGQPSQQQQGANPQQQAPQRGTPEWDFSEARRAIDAGVPIERVRAVLKSKGRSLEGF